VDDIGEQLAAAIIVPLRRRLDTALREAAGEDPAADAATIAQHISAAYREWKTQRIEQVAGDHLTAAFAIGVLTSSPQGTAWRWVVDDQDGACPDCDDNALAGPTPRGEVFPTGQPHPPAHPGCRCLLVPARR
jgi:class 3 adenylate cyclase